MLLIGETSQPFHDREEFKDQENQIIYLIQHQCLESIQEYENLCEYGVGTSGQFPKFMLEIGVWLWLSIQSHSGNIIIVFSILHPEYLGFLLCLMCKQHHCGNTKPLEIHCDNPIFHHLLEKFRKLVMEAKK